MVVLDAHLRYCTGTASISTFTKLEHAPQHPGNERKSNNFDGEVKKRRRKMKRGRGLQNKIHSMVPDEHNQLRKLGTLVARKRVPSLNSVTL